MQAWWLATLLALSPAPVPPAPAAPTSTHAETLEDVLAIPAPLRDALRTQVIERSVPGPDRLQRLAAFLFSPEGLGVRYRHDANHTVADTWRTREANCLAFTLLTVTLAREAGLDAYGQEIARTLSWYSEGETIYFSNHVNAGIRIGQRRYTVDVASDNVLTDRPPKPIDDARLLAIYHSNLAAEGLSGERLDDARRHVDAALASDAGYAPAWNNAGVLSLRQGAGDAAEASFLHALSLDPANDGALVNLAALYAHRGDRASAARYHKRIEQARQRNPFHHFMLALDAEKRGDDADAVVHYRRAIALYAGEHRFHFGLARAYLHLGDARRAGEALRRAEQASDGEPRHRYQAKLDLLRRQQGR